MLVFNSSLLAAKTGKATQGVGVMSLKKQKKLEKACLLSEITLENLARYRVKTIPAAGAVLQPEDRGEKQLSLLDEPG